LSIGQKDNLAWQLDAVPGGLLSMMHALPIA
jgi:hypothetical protein